MIELINAASYLDVPSLLELACGKLASIMKCKKNKKYIILIEMSKEELIKGFGLVWSMVTRTNLINEF